MKTTIVNEKSKYMKAICPGCGAEHFVKRGQFSTRKPKIYCQACKVNSKKYD